MTHSCFDKCPCPKMIEYDKEEDAYYIVDEEWTRLILLDHCPYCAKQIFKFESKVTDDDIYNKLSHD